MEKGVNYQVRSADYSAIEAPGVGVDKYYARARAAVYKKVGIMLPEEYSELTNRGREQFRSGTNDLVKILNQSSGSSVSSRFCEYIFN